VGGGVIALSLSAITIEIVALASRTLTFYIIEKISREIDSIDQQLDKLIADIPQWQERVNQLTSVKAVGKVLGLHVAQ
jgi:hypothetical protein